jgi:hypothetical protein
VVIGLTLRLMLTSVAGPVTKHWPRIVLDRPPAAVEETYEIPERMRPTRERPCCVAVAGATLAIPRPLLSSRGVAAARASAASRESERMASQLLRRMAANHVFGPLGENEVPLTSTSTSNRDGSTESTGSRR